MADYSLADLSSIVAYLGIPYEYFQWPEFVTMLIVPAILTTYALYSFFNERGPFKGHGSVNFILGVLISISTIRFSLIVMWISVGYIILLKIKSISWKLTFALIVASVYFSLSLLIFAVWSFFVSSALSRLRGRNPVVTVLTVIAITAAFYFAYSYVSPFIPSMSDLISGKWPQNVFA